MEILSARLRGNRTLNVHADYDDRRTLPMLLEMMPGADVDAHAYQNVDRNNNRVVCEIMFATEAHARAALDYFRATAALTAADHV